MKTHTRQPQSRLRTIWPRPSSPRGEAACASSLAATCGTFAPSNHAVCWSRGPRRRACVRLCEHAERTQAVQTATASAGLVLRVLPGRRARADARGTHSSAEARSSAEALYVAEKVCLLLLLLLLLFLSMLQKRYVSSSSKGMSPSLAMTCLLDAPTARCGGERDGDSMYGG